VDAHGNVKTFVIVYSLISRTYTVPNVNMDIPMIKQESSWQRVRQKLEVVKIFINEIMDQEDMIYTSKVISIHYHGNIIDSNHGNGTQPNKDFKTLLKAPSQ